MSNFMFYTGHADALRADMGDRRYLSFGKKPHLYKSIIDDVWFCKCHETDNRYSGNSPLEAYNEWFVDAMKRRFPPLSQPPTVRYIGINGMEVTPYKEPEVKAQPPMPMYPVGYAPVPEAPPWAKVSQETIDQGVAAARARGEF